MQFNIEIIDSRHFVSSEFRGGKPPRNSEYFMTVFYDGLYHVRGGKIEKTPRKTDFGNTDKFSARKISAKFYGKWGIRVKCTVRYVHVCVNARVSVCFPQ